VGRKAAWLYAAGLARLGHEVRVITSPGPMTSNFQDQGYKILLCNEESDIKHLLLSGWPEVVHHHVPGYYHRSIVYEAIKQYGRKPFRLLETNVFGWLTHPDSERYADYRMFISKASGAQAFLRGRIQSPQPYMSSHTVLYYPVPEPPLLTNENRHKIRKSLGISDAEVLAVRFGRPDARKWGDWECKAFAMAKKATPKLRFLMIEPPPDIKQRVDSGEFGEGILYRDMIASQEEIAQINQAADLGLHASRFGESFGYTIAEAMAAGLPVVTRTTPWGDNAQVELIEHGLSGFICDSVEGIAAAVAEIAHSSSLRSKMGAHAQKRILALASPDHEAALLSEICLGKTGPGSLVHHRNIEFADFCLQFPALEKRYYEHDRGYVDLKTHACASLENAWWIMKSKIRYYRAALRTSMGLPAYK
jgi:glycosyltransferase involved in cell wall biosynthesis